MSRGVDLLRQGMGLALLLLALAGCGRPAEPATRPPSVAANTPSISATIPPTVEPTEPQSTATLVPLVTRTSPPIPTPAPTRVPESSRCTTYQPPGTEGPIWDIEVAPDGAVWVVAFRGVARLHPIRREWIAVSVNEGPEVDQFRTITAGAGGLVWLVTRFDNGVYYWDGQSWSQLTSEDGLLSDWVNQVSVGPDGSAWFATEGGVSRWDRAEDTWTNYSGAGWLYDDVVKRVLFTPDGTIWFAHKDALTWWLPAASEDEGGQWGVYGPVSPMATRKAVVSQDGRLWLGQAFYDPESQAWSDTVYREIHLQDLAVDGRGGLWIARSDGAIYIPDPESSPPQAWLHLDKAQGLGGDDVTAIALERDGVVWFGTVEGVTRCFLGGLNETGQ